MKTPPLVLGLSLLASPLLAGVPLGRGEVSFDFTAAASYDSNVFGTVKNREDFFGVLTPHAVYVRKAGRIEAQLGALLSLERYARETQLDADNLSVDGALRVAADPDRRISGEVGAGYHENALVDPDLNGRVKSQSRNYLAETTVVTGPRTDFLLRADYSDVRRNLASDQQLLATRFRYSLRDFLGGNSLDLLGNYDRTRSSGDNRRGAELDQNSYSAMLGLSRTFYHDVIKAGATYGYRVLTRSAAETASGQTRQAGPVLSVNLEGPFLPAKYFPKMKSRLALGYQQSSTPGVNDTGSKELTGAMNLEWQARPNTAATFSANRSQRLSADDLSVVTSSVVLGLQQVLRYNLTGNVSAGYNWDSYRGTGRADETVQCNAALKYVFATTWSANASYRYTSAVSNLRASTYDRHIVSLGLSHQF